MLSILRDIVGNFRIIRISHNTYKLIEIPEQSDGENIKLPVDIFIYLAFTDLQVFSLLYRTCKEINNELRKSLPRARREVRSSVPGQPHLWIYFDGKYGIERFDFESEYRAVEYIAGKVINTVHRSKLTSSLHLYRNNERWTWCTDEWKITSYNKGKRGDKSWYTLRLINDRYYETKGHIHSYEFMPVVGEVNNYGVELELALSLLYPADNI